jgi:hypothetical protein
MAAHLVELLLGRPLALPASLLARHPELGEATWRRGGLPPRIGGWALGQSSVSGITLGRTVFLAPFAALEPALLLHELAHVHQFARDGAFPVRYLWESIRRGYRRNRFELEADRYAASRLSRPPSGV